jgi:signal peptidase II
MSTKHKAFFLALLLSLVFDQGTKVWARHTLRPMYPSTIEVVPGYFEFRYSENRGSAFGLFRDLPGSRYFLLVVGIGALFLIRHYLKKTRNDQLRVGAELGLLAGGALGNIIDRIAFNRVTDFIVWKIQSREWPTFNVADAALVVGIIGLLFDMKPDEKTAPAKHRG